VFGRKPKDDPAPVVEDGKKNAPTRKRREAEAANRRPLAPRDRRGSAQMTKEERVRARERMNRALQTGDERFLPPRDKGVARRWTRDWVDSHTSIGEFFILVALAMIVIMFASQSVPKLAVVAVLGMYGVTLLFAVDACVRGVLLRKALNKRFAPDEIPRGTVLYGVSRSIQLRRTRLPKPLVARGQHPE
jgi:hypothetical protein